jgi:hypothetical protein
MLSHNQPPGTEFARQDAIHSTQISKSAADNKKQHAFACGVDHDKNWAPVPKPKKLKRRLRTLPYNLQKHYIL